jgi:drug/metabolite transporter (DMT)-like permease
MVSINKTMGKLEWTLLIMLSILWGGSFFFSKVALAELRPFSVVLVRVGIAAAALSILVHSVGQRMPASLRLWGWFLVMGVLNNLVPFSLIFYGQTRIASGLASILNATTPLWTVLIAHLLTTDERLSSNRIVGVLLGLVGVVIMLGPDLLAGLGLNVAAQLAVIGATISYAFAGIFGRRFKGISPYVTAAGQLSCTTLLMTPIALWIDRPWQLPLPTAHTWLALVGLALLSTAVAYVIYFRLLSTVGATNLMLVTFLIPVSAMVLGLTILGERLDPRHFIGMALIGSGLAAIDGRPWKLIRKRLDFWFAARPAACVVEQEGSDADGSLCDRRR